MRLILPEWTIQIPRRPSPRIYNSFGTSKKSRGRRMPLSGSHSRSLRLIAAFKLFKGLALLAVGIGALKLLHKDVAAETARWVDLFRVDPDNRYIHRLLEKFSTLDAQKLKELSAGTFFYSALLPLARLSPVKFCFA